MNETNGGKIISFPWKSFTLFFGMLPLELTMLVIKLIFFVSRESAAIFDQLCQTFPDENCVLTSREILIEVRINHLDQGLLVLKHYRITNGCCRNAAWWWRQQGKEAPTVYIWGFVNTLSLSQGLSAGTWCLKEHLCNTSSVLSSSRCHVCTASYSVFFKVYWSVLCFLQNRSQPEGTRPPQLCSTGRQMVRNGHVARSHSLLTKVWPCELFYSHFFMCLSNRVTVNIPRQTRHTTNKREKS